jgi:hypothetical protein
MWGVMQVGGVLLLLPRPVLEHLQQSRLHWAMNLNQKPLSSPTFPCSSQPPPPKKPSDIFIFPPDDFQENEYVVSHGKNPEDFLERNKTMM